MLNRNMAALVLVALASAASPARAAIYHDADTTPDYIITLAELLRGIQFYNSFSFHCELGTEDGYAPGPGDTACAAHDSDYNPHNWIISLPELLRLIQFYNTPGYHPCDDPNSEDGFCPGLTGVSVPDAALEAALRGALAKPTGPLLPGELASLTGLSAPNSGIADLTGIEECTNLQTIDLHGNCIADLSPLAGLTQLEVLNLHANAIADVSPLATLITLRLLWLDHNQIEDPSPLVTNPGLGNTPAGTWDRIALAYNPLSAPSAAQAIGDLRAHGAGVWSSGPAGVQSPACTPPLHSGDPVPINVEMIHGDPALDDARCVVLLLFGDAYTDDKLDDPNLVVADVPSNGYNSATRTWSKCAADSIRFILSEEPFKEYAAYLKVYRVDLISNEALLSDNTQEPPIVHDTALGLAVESRAFSFDYNRLIRVADSIALKRDRILLIPNGHGSGDNTGEVTMYSNERASRTMTGLHEIGHGLGLLTDEYEYKHGTTPPTSEPPGTRAFANAISTGDTIPTLDDIPWKHWLIAECAAPDIHLGDAVDFDCLVETCQCSYDADFVDCIPLPTCEPGGNYIDVDGKIYGRSAWPEPSEDTPVGLYEGAWFRTKGAYRPELRCRMRSDDDVEPGLPETPHFCKVCREAMTLEIVTHAGNAAAWSPANDAPLHIPQGSGNVEFNVALHTPASPGHAIDVVSWEIDGQAQPGLINTTFSLDPTLLTTAQHEITVTLADRTPFVLPNYADGQSRLQQRIAWTVIVE